MQFSISLLESNKQINQRILSIIETVLSNAFNKSVNQISENIKQLIKTSIISEPEYLSLIGGKLRADLGIDDISKVDNLINNVVDLVTVEIKNLRARTNTMSGSLIVNFLSQDDLDNITNSAYSTIIDTKSGFVVPWAKWLLLDGTQILVKDFDVKYSSGGRSGMGYMINSASSWKVPNEFAGTKGNNWFTRAIDKINPNTINSILQSEIIKHI